MGTYGQCWRIPMKKMQMRIQEEKILDVDADLCPYCTMASQVIVKEIFKGTVQPDFSSVFFYIYG